MSKFAAIVLALVFALSRASALTAHDRPNPLHESELLALVAGNALPENIVAEIHSRGLAFSPDAPYRDLLKTAGADATILSALDSAKRNPSSLVEIPNTELLKHLSAAGKLIRDKKFDEAANELTPALAGNFERYEVGFVMGELLRQQENWQQAAAVYTEVLEEGPDFPEAHTKLSLIMYKLSDGQEGLRHAKAALAQTPDNPEAHKNAGLALQNLGKPEAALQEYKEALRLKPDYAVIHLDMSLALDARHDYDAAIAEMKKYLALTPDDAWAHYELGLDYFNKGDLPSALPEYREAKRLAPKEFAPRQNLAVTLMDLHRIPDAVREFREMEGIFPESSVCHRCLGGALQDIGDLRGAEKELRLAVKLDPLDADNLVTLAGILEEEKAIDEALELYLKAEQLDPNNFYAHRSIGALMLSNKNLRVAVRELKAASDVSPTDASTLQLYGQALTASGDLPAAIVEFKRALALEPKHVGIMLDLAAAYEKSGDWTSALSEYHQAAISDQQPVTRSAGVAYSFFDAGRKYSEAQQRFNKHIAELKASGNAAAAAKLKKTVQVPQSNSPATSTAPGTLDSLLQSAAQAFVQRRLDDAERDYNKALAMAEKIKPIDGRLATCLGFLGQLAAYRRDFAGANVLLERALKVTEQVYGSQNAALADPLKWLALNSMVQGDFSSAERFLGRALEINRITYGETSAGYGEILGLFARVYMSQQNWEKAEPYMLQASTIEEKLYQYNPQFGVIGFANLVGLCSLYEAWGKTNKLEPCDRRLISVLEKNNDGDRSQLEMTLAREARTLRSLGRPDEADKVEQHLRSLGPDATYNPN